MKLKTLAAAVAALMIPCAPAHAEDSEVYAEVGGWTIFRGSDDCNLLTRYEGGASLYVAYTVGNNDAVVYVDDPAFKSIKDAEKYPLKVYFMKAKGLDDSWGEVTATGVATDTLHAIRMKFVGTDFLADLAASSTFARVREEGKVVVESMTLKGSAAAVAKLEQCSREVHRKNPADPFAN